MVTCRNVLGLVAMMIATPAVSAAETIVVGQGGGFYCAQQSEMETLVSAIKEGRKIDPPKSCGWLKAGVRIEAGETMKENGLAAGRGLIDGKENVPFVVEIDLPKPTSAGRTFKRVSPDDIRNTPTKWVGRDLEFAGAQIYWVDDTDVRVVTSSMLTLFATAVRGEDVDYFRSNCETQAEALSSKCRATVRFRYSEHSEDKPTGLAKRTVLTSNDVELVRPKRGR